MRSEGYLRRRSGDRAPSRRGDEAPPSDGSLASALDSVGWVSKVVEINRDQTETVRAIRWTRGEEEIITLQWLLEGSDGTRYPVNVPPTPPEWN